MERKVERTEVDIEGKRTEVDIEGKRAGRRREEENEKEVTGRDGQTKPNETKKRGTEEGK